MTFTMRRHMEISPRKNDRLAIRELVDEYAHVADHRDVEGQISLTADTEFLVYMDGRNPVPTQEIRGPDGLRPRVCGSERVRSDNPLQRPKQP
jgi:hypothetical protein